MRFVESLFEPKTLAILFLGALCVTLALYRDAESALQECRLWSARAFVALPKSSQEELRAERELRRDLAEPVTERPTTPRD